MNRICCEENVFRYGTINTTSVSGDIAGDYWENFGYRLILTVTDIQTIFDVI
jgi:hypothetical protein